MEAGGWEKWQIGVEGTIERGGVEIRGTVERGGRNGREG